VIEDDLRDGSPTLPGMYDYRPACGDILGKPTTPARIRSVASETGARWPEALSGAGRISRCGWGAQVIPEAAEAGGRMPGESARAFEAFRHYRDLGASRSTAKVAQELGKAKTLIDRWSADWSWVRRAAAWDEEQDRVWRAAASVRQAEMARRHVEMARQVQEKLLQRLNTLTVDEIGVRDLPRLLDIAVKIERQAMGVDNSKAAVDVPTTPTLLPVDYSRKLMSTPEGRDLAARQIELLARA
jgi:hypothetical protein